MCPKCSRKMYVSITRLAEGKIWCIDKCENCSWQSLEYYTEDQPTREEYIQLLEELVDTIERDKMFTSEVNYIRQHLHDKEK